MAVVDLGGGRAKKTDPIDHSVGIKVIKKIGDRVEKGDVLMLIYYNDSNRLEAALNRLKNTYSIKDELIERPPVIYEHIE